MLRTVHEDIRIDLIIRLLQDKKGLEIRLLDLRQVSDAADYFVICTGSSEPHVKALVKDLVDKLRQANCRPWHLEGTNSNRWVLIDLVDVAIHIFRQEAREFYALERLWGDAPSTSHDLANTGQDTPFAIPEV